jgi:ubiquitin-conjugating enzyme E2 H
MAGYDVELENGSSVNFHVTFKGPVDTIYEGGFYRIHVELPEQYPFSSPSIGFEPHTMWHPNVDERSGSVCLDVINQTWTPMYSMVNIFDVFLPQLLTYPNPGDPLNSDAAGLYMKDTQKYEEKVRLFVEKTKKMYADRQREKSERMSSGMSSGASTGSGGGGVPSSSFSLNGSGGSDAHSDAGRASNNGDFGSSPSPNTANGGAAAKPPTVDFELNLGEDADDMDCEFD